MRAAVMADPTFYNAQVSLAILLFLHQGKGAEGQRMLEDILERKIPDIGPREVTWIRYYLGRAHEIAGNLERADVEYQASLNFDPKFFRAAIARGAVKFRQATARQPRAEVGAKAGSKAGPKSPVPAQRRALIDESLRQYRRAIELIEEYSGSLEILSANDLAPETPPAFERQEYNRGIIDLKAFLRIQKSEAYFSVAKIRALLDEQPKAVKELTSAIENLGVDRRPAAKDLLVSLHNYRAYLLEETGEPAEALKDYQAVVRSDLDPGNKTARDAIHRLAPRRTAAGGKDSGAAGATRPAGKSPGRTRTGPPEDE
jgi:tetratricopeptide (TPR) repeat protein